jgi:NDP-sugar pyrophosphorylase family protein
VIVGFCLAAGAGTRLGPLTEATAKPLLAPAGRALLDLALSALGLAGAGRAVVNAHHGADQLASSLAAGVPGFEPWPATVELLREERLLGTGGGLAHAVRHGLLPAPVVLVTCADHVLDPADLARLAEPVRAGAAEAVMGLAPAATVGGPLSFDLDLDLDRAAPDRLGRVRRAAGGPWASAGTYAFAGHVLADRFEPAGDGRPAGAVAPANLVDALLEPLWLEGRLAGLPMTGPMADAGTLDRFLDAAEGLLAGRWAYRLPPGRRDGAAWIADGAAVRPGAELRGPVVVDHGAVVGEGAVVTRSVLGPGSAARWPRERPSAAACSARTPSRPPPSRSPAR